ncbi:MAG TPA: flavin reductase family protein, partial [Allosphingosinicella sp.]
AEAQAAILCRRIRHFPYGTHSIFVGEVEEVTVRGDVDPLLYVDGRYGGANEAVSTFSMGWSRVNPSPAFRGRGGAQAKLGR